MDTKYILLFGGESNERLVSFASAQFMAQALSTAKLWYWHNDGKIFELSHSELMAHDSPFTTSFTPSSAPIFNQIREAIDSPRCEGHIFVLGLHGGAGENGELQEMLESKKLIFTGSGSMGAKQAFDKINAKSLLKTSSAKMPEHQHLITSTTANNLDLLHNFFLTNGPLIIKPIRGGSSLGCVFVKKLDDIANAAEQITKDPAESFMMEKLIYGREITIGVVQSESGIIALPVTEIVLQKTRDFDYQGKYLGQGSLEVTPADLPEQTKENAQQIAIEAHLALGLSGYSRTDMILADDGIYFLETNSLPGLTKNSLIPQQLAAAKITMSDFLLGQITFAANKGKSTPKA